MHMYKGCFQWMLDIINYNMLRHFLFPNQGLAIIKY